MNIQESRVLFDKKVNHEYKPISKALYEINELELSQVKFKNLEKENRSLLKEIKRLEYEKDKIRDENFKLHSKQDFMKVKVVNREDKLTANTHHLKSILLYLKIGKGTYKEISKETGITEKQSKDGLEFLNKFGLIEKVGKVFYK